MHFSTCACLSVRSQMSPAKYYFCCFSGCFSFQQMHGNNATHAIKFPSFFTKHSTASTLKTFHFACNCFLNIKVWMKSNLIGKKKKKNLHSTLPPSHCWAITVHTTRQLPDSVTARSIFRCMNKTFSHLSQRLLCKWTQEKTRGIPPSLGWSSHSVKSVSFAAYFSSAQS